MLGSLVYLALTEHNYHPHRYSKCVSICSVMKFALSGSHDAFEICSPGQTVVLLNNTNVYNTVYSSSLAELHYLQ